DPDYPAAALVRGSDGALYGVTPLGGSATLGTVFRIDSAGNFTSLHSFNGEDGSEPVAALVVGSDGALYGTTKRGGEPPPIGGVGSVFRIDGAGNFTSLPSFNVDGTDGANPSTPLVLGSDGALYGVTSIGGSSNLGTVFRIDSTGSFTSLHSFDGT